MKLGLIVEGHGEVTALPVLLRRLAWELAQQPLDIPPPIRLPKGKMKKAEELRRAVELIARKTSPDGAIMIVLDADEECPAQLGPALLREAQSARGDRNVSVVVANREYEAWLIAGANGLAGHRGLPDDLVAPDDVERIKDAKGWLDQRLEHGYQETIDQARLSDRFDLDAAQASASFCKLRRDLARLLSNGPAEEATSEVAEKDEGPEPEDT